MSNLIDKLKISDENLKTINDFLLNPENPLIKSIIEIINKFGTPEEINAKAKEAGKLENLMKRLKEKNSSYYADLEWLIEQKEKGAFIKLEDYYKKILGDKYESTKMKEDYAITLELSALQFFPFFMKEAKYAIEHQELMPGRYIKVRNMKEQVEDGQLLATSCAMKVIGSSYVETLDTKGTDGSNVHLGLGNLMNTH